MVMGPVAVEVVVVVVVELVARRTIFLFLLGKPPRPLSMLNLGGLPSGGPCAMLPCCCPSATGVVPLFLVVVPSKRDVAFCIFDLGGKVLPRLGSLACHQRLKPACHQCGRHVQRDK